MKERDEKQRKDRAAAVKSLFGFLREAASGRATDEIIHPKEKARRRKRARIARHSRRMNRGK